jgi:hypothetical protein
MIQLGKPLGCCVGQRRCWLGYTLATERLMITSRSTILPALEDLPNWKRIKLGLYKGALAYRRAMNQAGIQVCPGAEDLLGKRAFTTSDTEVELDLVAVSAAELVLKKDAKYTEICARAKMFGLELCPAEVGPGLCLTYKGQLRDEYLIIGMKAITDSDGVSSVFVCERIGGGIWLYSASVVPGSLWGADPRFVFQQRIARSVIRRRKSAARS